MIDETILSSNIADDALRNETPLEAWRKKYIPIRIFCLLLSIWGVIGNGMLIHLLCCRIKKTRFTVYILNITIAEFILVFYYFIDNILFLSATKKFVLLPFLQYITYLFANDNLIYFLTVVCIERYLMIFYPVWYESHRSKKLTPFICLITWILSLAMMLWEYFSCHQKYDLNLYVRCEIVLTIHVATNFLVVIGIMFFCAVAILIKIPKRSQRNLPTRLDISIVATVVRVLILWLPFRIVDYLRVWISSPYFPNHFFFMMITESIFCSVCPCIYLFVGWWKSPKVQRSIPMFIERALTDREENTSVKTQEDQEQA